MSLPESGPAARPVDAIADQFVNDYAAVDPVSATFIGVSGYDHLLPDLTLDGYAEREALTRAAHEAMRGAEPVDDLERAAKSSFLERLGVELDQADAHTPQSQISVIVSELHSIRGSFDLMPQTTEEDWSNVSKRLAAVPVALGQYKQTLLAEAADGHVSAKRQLAEVAAQVRSWTGQIGAGGDLFRKLAESADVSDSLATELLESAATASGAYSDFGTFLDDELLPLGRDREGAGREQYQRDSRYFLGATVDLEETYAWGWEELHRIEMDMAATARKIATDQVAPTSSDAAAITEANAAAVGAAVDILDGDPARRIHGADNFRAGCRSLPSGPSPRWPTPTSTSRSRSGGSSAASPRPTTAGSTTPDRARTSPARAGCGGRCRTASRTSRPGARSPPSTTRACRAITCRSRRRLPRRPAQPLAAAAVLGLRPRRGLGAVRRAADGRARLPRRPGRPAGHARRPGASARRGSIVDIGMHLELDDPRGQPVRLPPGRALDAAAGLEFMRAHCRMEDACIVFEVNRYLGWPGQAPSYKVGERIWLQAREEVKQRKGADFDLKAFHRAALDLGSLGLDPLREALARL